MHLPTFFLKIISVSLKPGLLFLSFLQNFSTVFLVDFLLYIFVVHLPQTMEKSINTSNKLFIRINTSNKLQMAKKITRKWSNMFNDKSYVTITIKSDIKFQINLVWINMNKDSFT